MDARIDGNIGDMSTVVFVLVKCHDLVKCQASEMPKTSKNVRIFALCLGNLVKYHASEMSKVGSSLNRTRQYRTTKRHNTEFKRVIKTKIRFCQ